MAAIRIDGINDEALDDEGTDARDLLTDLAGNSPDFDGDGRIFELLELEVSNEHASAVVVFEMWDANEGAAPGAANQKGTFIIPAQDTYSKSWPLGAGPTFATGIVGSSDGNAGTVNIGGVHVSGVLH